MTLKNTPVKGVNDTTLLRVWASAASRIVAVFMITAMLLSASDGKVYSGAICKPATSTVTVEYPMGTVGLGIHNPNQQTIPIVCPIIRDAIGSSNETTATEQVRVVWTGAWDTIICGLKSVLEDGTVRGSAGYGSRWGPGWFYVDNVTHDKDKTSALFLDCQLPANGTLTTIQVKEPGQP